MTRVLFLSLLLDVAFGLFLESDGDGWMDGWRSLLGADIENMGYSNGACEQARREGCRLICMNRSVEEGDILSFCGSNRDQN